MDAVELSPGHLCLRGELTVHHVEALAERLLAVQRHAGPLCIDLSELEALDTAAAQVLLAFVRGRGSLPLAIVGIPDPLGRELSRGGLLPHLLRP